MTEAGFLSKGRRRSRDQIHFVESCFGGHLLVLEGHVYRRKSVVSGRSYWNCCGPKCSAKGILLPNGEFQPTDPRHTHEPDPENLKRREKLLELKKLALQVDVPGQDLLEALHIKDDVKKHLGLVRTWRSRDKKKSRGDSHAEPGTNVGVDYRLSPSRIPPKEMLFHSGHYFRQDSVNPRDDKCKYWRCRVKKCKARAKTDAAGNLTISKSVHDHAAGKNEETRKLRPEQTLDASRKLPWRAKGEPETAESEKPKFGRPESVAAVEDTGSPFGPPDNFNLDKLMAETLDEDYF